MIGALGMAGVKLEDSVVEGVDAMVLDADRVFLNTMLCVLSWLGFVILLKMTSVRLSDLI